MAQGAKKQDQSSRSLSRRDMVKAMGAVSAASAVAGCGLGGSGDNGNGDHGERVPTMDVQYFAARGGYTRTQEASMPALREAHTSLGIEFNAEGAQYSSVLDNALNDLRQSDYTYHNFSLPPSRLDPNQMTRWWAVDWAGATGALNLSQYSNCEYSLPAVQQQFAETNEERRELVTEAQKILAEDVGVIPIFAVAFFSGARTDNVELDRTGRGGFLKSNPMAHIYSTPSGGQTLNINTTSQQVESTNYPYFDSVLSIQAWNKLVHSPLFIYDENYELQNELAANVEVTDQAQTYNIELKDATFHNGDPITAEDVQFTFEYLNDTATGPYTPDMPLDSVDVVDEKNVQFNFNKSYLPAQTTALASWGILHKQTWVEGGAEDNPEAFELDPLIGSGPFEVTTFQSGALMELAPHPEDGHPNHSPNHNITFEVYTDEATTVQAFDAGELDVIEPISPSTIQRIEDEMGNAEVVPTEGFCNWILAPQQSFAPTKFKSMRLAVGRAMNRDQANQLAYRGLSEPALNANSMSTTHPWLPPIEELTLMTDDPTGDVEGARQVLEDAGFTWDSDDNLHYPADADLSPVWPKGETPSAEDFPCLTELQELSE